MITPEYRAKILGLRPRFEQIAREQYGITVNVGEFGINSRPALIGAKYAETTGYGEAYHAAVMDAYWQKAQDISDLSVLREIAQTAGLDSDQFESALSDQTYIDQVNADIDQAHQYGISGVPAQVVASKYLISGAQPYEVFVQAVEKIRAE